MRGTDASRRPFPLHAKVQQKSRGDADRYYPGVGQDFLSSPRYADWTSNRIRSHAALRDASAHLRIRHSSLLVFTLLPFPPPRPFCSSLSSFWPLLVRSPSSCTYLRLDYRAFHVLSDCALLTRILSRNYQEEEIVGRKVCRQKTRSRMKAEGKGEGRLPTILSFPRASVRTSG